MKTLGNLLYEIEEQLKDNEIELEPWRGIEEVDSFLSRRKRDLFRFKSLIGGYSLQETNITIASRLREQLSNSESRIFGGICLNGAEYFKITKKVYKAIEKEQNRLIKQSRESDEASKINFDENFCIPDELDKDLENQFFNS